jgi:hypothetical protein
MQSSSRATYRDAGMQSDQFSQINYAGERRGSTVALEREGLGARYLLSLFHLPAGILGQFADQTDP